MEESEYREYVCHVCVHTHSCATPLHVCTHIQMTTCVRCTRAVYLLKGLCTVADSSIFVVGSTDMNLHVHVYVWPHVRITVPVGRTY